MKSSGLRLSIFCESPTDPSVQTPSTWVSPLANSPGAMRAWEQSDLAGDRANVGHAPAIRSLSCFQDPVLERGLQRLLEGGAERLGIGAFSELLDCRGLDFGDLLVAPGPGRAPERRPALPIPRRPQRRSRRRRTLSVRSPLRVCRTRAPDPPEAQSLRSSLPAQALWPPAPCPQRPRSRRPPS